MFIGGDWVFVHVPKTGGQSMERSVSEKSKSYFDIHSPLYAAEELIEPEALYSEKYWKFAFVRNPFDWEVSNYFWHNFANSNGDIPKCTFDEWVKWRYDDDQSIIKIDHFKKLNKEDDYWYFKGFGKNPQLGMFLSSNGEFSVDFVGRFENLNKDWQKVCSVLNIENDLKHYGKSKHNDYRQYYNNSETYDIVEVAKRIDLQVFNYNFDGAVSNDINTKFNIDFEMDLNYNYYYDDLSRRK